MIEINPAKLEEEIEKFKRGIEKRNPDEFEILKQKSVKDKDSIHAAVFLAYNDAKRTMSGIKEEDRDNALKDIETALYNYYDSELAPEFDEMAFNEEHKKICEKWWKMFEGSELGTYGKAQKIVNMSFKYLRCCKDAQKGKKYHGYFKYCHMPLDSFTLEWFKREFDKEDNRKQINWFYIKQWPKNKPRIVGEKIAAWSALKDDERGYYCIKDDKSKNDKEYYSYRFYHKNISSYIKNNKDKYQNNGDVLSPLELEFLVWPEIQRHLAAEGFLIGLENNLPDEEKTDDEKKKDEEKIKIKDMSLDEKYRKVVKLLIEKGYRGDIIKLLADIVETLTEKGYKISISAETEEHAEIVE